MISSETESHMKNLPVRNRRPVKEYIPLMFGEIKWIGGKLPKN